MLGQCSQQRFSSYITCDIKMPPYAHTPSMVSAPTLQVYGVNSHRLALAMTKAGKLAPLVREAVLQEMGIQSGNIRVANLL